MNKKKIFTLALSLTTAMASWGISIPDSLNYSFRMG